MTPRPIILDCDPGHDDAIAILLAVASPELDLQAVTTVSGNQTLDKTTNNALRVLELAGRTDIPVYAGADAPFVRKRDVAAHVHGESGLDGPDLPPPSQSAQPEHAVEFLGRRYRSADTPVLVATGPLTNVGLLFATHADARPERIVLMGGAIGEGNRTPAAEFNIWADPEAAALVLAAGFRNLTLVPLDATHKAVISLDQCKTLRASGKPAAEAAAIFTEKRIDGYRSYQRLADQEAAPIHDALCIASMIEPDIIQTENYHVAVETSGTLTVGRTVVDTNFRSGHDPTARVAMNADTERFGRFVLDTLINN